ncbi:MAG: NHL repeat-containing protein [Candidatus Aminicenantales bacterium]
MILPRKTEIIAIALVIAISACTRSEKKPFEKTVEVEPVFYLDDFSSTIKPDFFANNTLALDKEGNIYIVDNGRHRIVRLNRDGKFINSIGSIGQGEQDLFNPVGVEVVNNCVYVLNNWGKDLKRFSPEGKFISGFQIENAGVTQALAVSDEGIFVATRNEIAKSTNLEEYNRQRLLRLYDPHGRQIGSLGGTIPCATVYGHLEFNSAFIRVIEGKIFGAYKNIPRIFSYGNAGQENFIRDLEAMKIAEIMKVSETARGNNSDSPNHIRNPYELKVCIYCAGISIHRDRIYYALPMGCSLLEFDLKGHYMGIYRLNTAKGKPLNFWTCGLDRNGKIYGLGEGEGSGFYFFRSI